MPSDLLRACLDANVLISAIAFDGIPWDIVCRHWEQEFSSVTSLPILDEVRKAFTVKLPLPADELERFLAAVLRSSVVVVPTGKLVATGYPPDDLVLETALLGKANVLVTGDKRHLLAMRPPAGLVIESPAAFLKRLVS